jgi:hypothetical protein
VPVLRDVIDDAGVPVVQCCGEVHEEDDGDAAFGPQLAVRVRDVPAVTVRVAASAYEAGSLVLMMVFS